MCKVSKIPTQYMFYYSDKDMEGQELEESFAEIKRLNQIIATQNLTINLLAALQKKEFTPS